MRALVVGGTGFLGSAIARACVAAGEDVFLLSRRSSVEVAMPEFELLTGDRHHDLSVLKGNRFDLIFDTCGYTPDAIENLLDAVEPFKGRYVFVSSASVYGDYSRLGLTEDIEVPRATPEHLALAASVPSKDRASAAAYGEAYGPLKRECECAAIERLGDRALILRSGLLVGAGDYTDRLTWWLRRLDAGGQIPIPGPPERPIQLIDVRDAATFAYHGARCRLHGIYNLTSKPVPIASLFDTAMRVGGSNAELIWIDEEKVKASGIKAWTDIPLWLPATSSTYRHFFEIDVEKAHTFGLPLRPFEETIDDIITWDRGRRDEPMKCGMSKAHEDILLATAC